MCNGFAHHGMRLHGFAARPLRGLRRVAGVTRDLLHRQPHFMHSGGNHIGHLVLATSTPCRVVDHLRHLPYRATQLFAGMQHVSDQLAQAADETVETTRQIAQLVGPALIQTPREITTAATNLDQGAGDLANRLDQPARQQHHQEEEEQRNAQADQAGGPHGSLGFAKYLSFRHFADEDPAQALQWLRQRQERFAFTLEAYRLPFAGQQATCRLRPHQPGKIGAVVVFAAGVNLDPAIGPNQIDLAALTEAKTADQLGHVFQAIAQPGNTQLLAIDTDALIDEQRGLSRGLVDIDFNTALCMAVDQAVEPAITSDTAAQRSCQTVFRVVMTALQHGYRGGQRTLLRLNPIQIAAHRSRLLVTLALAQPLLNQGVAGNTRSSRDRRHQGTFDVITDGGDIGRQGFADQITLGQAIDRRGIHQNDNQHAGQQGRAHTDDQLPLDTALHKAHGVALIFLVVLASS